MRFRNCIKDGGLFSKIFNFALCELPTYYFLPLRFFRSRGLEQKLKGAWSFLIRQSAVNSVIKRKIYVTMSQPRERIENVSSRYGGGKSGIIREEGRGESRSAYRVY